jgi:isoleucyl-tRNA synthetase
MYKGVEPSPDFIALEHGILGLWERTGAFKLLAAQNKGRRRWSFLDGPITSNNPMGVHHAWGRTYKDFFRRFQAMNGFEPSYQNGFDCQGLWVEVEVEKELGFRTKRDIEAFGIAEFVKRCKQRALRFAAVQTEQSIRLGYWMEWDNPAGLRRLADGLDDPEKEVLFRGPKGGEVRAKPEKLIGSLGSLALGGSYFTLSDSNNYAIWATLKKCHERGWIYKGRDVMPWCPRCSTALSEHEISAEGYREVEHDSPTVMFPIRGRKGEALLVWTTTPWTLTSNVAVAVNPTVPYVRARRGDRIFYIAKAAVGRVLGDSCEVLEELSGSDMEGLTYEGPFDDLEEVKRSGAAEQHRVILWKDVGETEGTGLVHIAPGCGKEDFELGKQLGLAAISPLDEYGVFVDGFGKFSGTGVQGSARSVTSELEARGFLFRSEKYRHRYPVCWRCQSELVYRLVAEWFISMGAKLGKPLEETTQEERDANLRYQVMEVNRQIKWTPSFGLLQELDWLQNMGDWMISKKRYWGLALPIWECQKCGRFAVIGSREELKARAKAGWADFDGHSPHRPWVDAVKIECEGCGELVQRIPEVANPWLDAGIVAYSTLGYFDARDYWEKWFPADLICESLPGQFRNWFYALLTMSTILENRPPCLSVFGYGNVLAEDGRQMHKSWGNAIWFDEAVESMGADVMRWMYLSSRPETNIRFGFGLAEEVRRSFLLPLWNVYSFFVTYANLDHWRPNGRASEPSYLDRWMTSKLQVLVREVTESVQNLDPQTATAKLGQFVNDLSKWYVRRSRRRFWKTENDKDKEVAYATLHSCLATLARLLAPFTPFVSEELYQNLVRSVDNNAPVSVHLTGWPASDESLVDSDCMSSMDLAIRVCSLGHAARNEAGIKIRQPLAKAVVAGEPATLKQLENVRELIKDELNVKGLSLVTEKEGLLDYKVHPLPRALGAKYRRLLPKIMQAAESVDQNRAAQELRGGRSMVLKVDGKEISLASSEVEVVAKAKPGLDLVEEGGLLVGVDTTLSDALTEEGLVRDVVRRIQNQRKEAGFEISDMIETYYSAGPRLAGVFGSHGELIRAETLSRDIVEGEPPSDAHVKVYEVGGEKLRLGLRHAVKTPRKVGPKRAGGGQTRKRPATKDGG